MGMWVIIGFLAFLGAVGLGGAITGFVAAAPRARQGALTAIGAGVLALVLGFVGTIVGLVTAFGAVGRTPPEQKQALLSKGIAEAMNGTAIGIALCAVCCVLGALGLLRVSRLTKTAPPGERG